MFEKEAEEIMNNHCDCEMLSECLAGIRTRCTDFEESKKLLIEGIEFGYNKANEWHYVKDGDLPKDEDWKWCVSYRGYYYIAKYEEMFGCWTNQEYSEVMQPYAWKEIVLPELPKESEWK